MSDEDTAKAVTDSSILRAWSEAQRSQQSLQEASIRLQRTTTLLLVIIVACTAINVAAILWRLAH